MSIVSEWVSKYWPEDDRRLVGMLWLVAGIVLVYSLLLLHDFRVEREAVLEQDLSRLSRVQTVLSDTKWEELALAADKARTELDTSFWSASGEGVAKAAVQAELESLLKQHGIPFQVVSADSIREDISGVDIIKVLVILNGDFNSYTLSSFLKDLEYSPKLFVVEQLDISTARRKTFRASVSSWVVIKGQ